MPVIGQAGVSLAVQQRSATLSSEGGRCCCQDVFLWHMGTLHQNGANVTTNGANVTTDEIRVSFNCGYLPAWFNHRIMGGHQPTFPANYEKMPEAVRQFLPRVTGYDRHDAYEYHAIPRPPTDEAEPFDDWATRTAGTLEVSGGRVAEPLAEGEVSAAVAKLEAEGFCVLESRLGAEAAQALCKRMSACHAAHATAGAEALFGAMNVAPAAWAVGASQPEAARIARQLVGPRVRVVDVAVSLGSGAGAELCAHRSARMFEVGLPQPECPWLIEGVWALSSGCEVSLVPASHQSRQPAPEDGEATVVKTVKLSPGSVLLCHGGLWMQRSSTSLPACAGTAMHVRYFATWWNHWLEDDLQPLWPESYAAMPEAVQALMPGLLGRQRSELYESAFNEDGELNFARFERRRREAMAEPAPGALPYLRVEGGERSGKL